MFFVTPKGCPNHGLKLKLGKNYHSNNSIWPAVRHVWYAHSRSLLLLLHKTYKAEFLALKHECRILRHSTNPVFCFSIMEQGRLCAVWSMENWLSSFLNQIQGWTTVRESYLCALEQGPLLVGRQKANTDRSCHALIGARIWHGPNLTCKFWSCNSNIISSGSLKTYSNL